MSVLIPSLITFLPYYVFTSCERFEINCRGVEEGSKIKEHEDSGDLKHDIVVLMRDLHLWTC
jgi:hypothetical protein